MILQFYTTYIDLKYFHLISMQNLHQAYHPFFGKGYALYQLFSPYRIYPLGGSCRHQQEDVPEEDFDRYAECMSERFTKRARHLYPECERVRKGVET